MTSPYFRNDRDKFNSERDHLPKRLYPSSNSRLRKQRRRSESFIIPVTIISLNTEIPKSCDGAETLIQNQNKILCAELKQMKCDKYNARLREIKTRRDIKRLIKTETQFRKKIRKLKEKNMNLKGQVEDGNKQLDETRMQAVEYSQRNNRLSEKLYECQLELFRKQRLQKKKTLPKVTHSTPNSPGKHTPNSSRMFVKMMKRRMSFTWDETVLQEAEDASDQSVQRRRIRMNAAVDFARLQKRFRSLRDSSTLSSRLFRSDLCDVEARICKKIDEFTYENEMQYAMSQVEVVRDMNLQLMYKLALVERRVGNLKRRTFWGWSNVFVEVLPRFFTMILRESKKMAKTHSLVKVECVRKDECRFSLQRKICGKSEGILIEDFKCPSEEACNEWTNYLRFFIQL